MSSQEKKYGNGINVDKSARPELPYSSSLADLVQKLLSPIPPHRATSSHSDASSKSNKLSHSDTDVEHNGIHKLIHSVFPHPPPQQTHVPWYSNSLIPKLEANGKHSSYEAYTGLKELDLLRHIEAIRDRAWAIAPYPCIGRGWFLLPGLTGRPIWQENVVPAAKSGQIILDLGCGLGQDLRGLRLSAGPSAHLYAVDKSQEMWNLGYDLFKDGGGKRKVADFLCGDARSIENREWKENIDGMVDVVILSRFLDLFGEGEQLEIGETVVGLSKVGAKIVGMGFGVVKRGSVEGKDENVSSKGGVKTLHDVESFTVLWEEVGKKTGTRWRVEARLVEVEEWGLDEEDIAWMEEPGLMGMEFVVTREA